MFINNKKGDNSKINCDVSDIIYQFGCAMGNGNKILKNTQGQDQFFKEP
jgi:hypothetical protein